MSAVGRILVVGGGASGTLLAAHLLRHADERLRVALVEKRADIGRGLAYSTKDPDHILNTRVASMSAFADDPEHFWRWLQETGAAGTLPCADPFCFVPRRLYGTYLGSLLEPYLAGTGDGRLEILQGECVDLSLGETGAALRLSDGSRQLAGAVVLATGHDMPSEPPAPPYADAGLSPAENGIGRDDDVLILGTGLSMVDAVIRLLNEGHRGRILALSRHGKLPQPHRRNAPLAFDAADMPLGTEISYILRWFRRTARWAEARGGDWRDVVDGIRPHTAALWASLSPEARRRFLRHARTFWDIHRHRLPEEGLRRLEAARIDGRLTVAAGRTLSIEPGADGASVTYLPRGETEPRTIGVRRVIACTGVLRQGGGFANPLLSALAAHGLARRDDLGISLDVDAGNALVGAAGAPVPRLFALGPLTAARHWEATAVPDIRLQAARLATHLREILTPPASLGGGLSQDPASRRAL